MAKPIYSYVAIPLNVFYFSLQTFSATAINARKISRLFFWAVSAMECSWQKASALSLFLNLKSAIIF